MICVIPFENIFLLPTFKKFIFVVHFLKKTKIQEIK